MTIIINNDFITVGSLITLRLIILVLLAILGTL
jgi:hypothetical protein